jgi:hypothetical protein
LRGLARKQWKGGKEKGALWAPPETKKAEAGTGEALNEGGEAAAMGGRGAQRRAQQERISQNNSAALSTASRSARLETPLTVRAKITTMPSSNDTKGREG